MAQYIGQSPINGFHAKQSLTGDGSTTAFTLDQTVASETAILVSVGGVLQEPAVAYNLTIGGTKIDFTEAPSSTDTVYIHFLGKAIVQNLIDVNGAEFVLDANGNTSLTADTDDEIDIKVGGTDISTIKSTGFHNIDNVKFVAGAGDDLQLYHDGTNSFLTNSEGALKIATETSGIAVTIGHTTSEVTIADNATVTGNLTVTGTLTQTGTQTFDGGIDVDNFNINGTTLALSSGDMLIDVAGDITFDADGGDFKFSDGGTQILNIANSSSDVVIKPTVDAKDIIFQQYDGTEVARIEDNATFNVSVAGKFAYAGTAVTSTAAELNIVDGGTSATSTTVADADRVVMNDNGTMVQVAVTDLAAYFDDEITAMPNLASVGTLTALTVDDVAVDGKVITMTGSSSDTAVFTAGTNGTLSIVTTDAGGAAGNIQITADGTAELAGTTVTLDSAGGITLDADGGTITFADAGSSLGTITSSGYSGTSAAATTVTITDNESTNENNVIVFVAGADSDGGTGLGLESDGNLTYNPSTGTLSATNLVVSGTQTITNSVTMNASNAVVFEGATADAHETTLTTIDATGDRTISLPNVAGTLPVLAAVSATAITSTPEELNILDGATVVVGEINALDLGSTAVGTAIASKAVILDSNKDYTGLRNFTVTGELDAATGDFSSDVDIDGDLLCGDDVTLDSDAAVLGFGADKDVTLTHVADTGLLLNDNMVIQFNDASQNIGATSNAILDINATDEIELNATLVDINANVEISGTATTTGVHTFTAVPVFPNNTVETADIQADAITNAKIADDQIDSEHYVDGSIDTAHLAADAVTGAKIADDAINSEHYTDGSIDTAHIADLNVTGAKLALDHRSSGNADDVKTGNQHDYIFFDGDVGISFFTANAEDMRLEDDGDLHVDKDVIAFSTTISDERLKENIQPIEDALSKVSQLNGVTFTYKADGKESAGLIAQDVEKVLPSAISEKQLPLKIDDGVEYKVLQYDQTIGLLVEAIKELTAKVEKLENK